MTFVLYYLAIGFAWNVVRLVTLTISARWLRDHGHGQMVKDHESHLFFDVLGFIIGSAIWPVDFVIVALQASSMLGTYWNMKRTLRRMGDGS